MYTLVEIDEEEFYKQQKGLPNRQTSYNPFGYGPVLSSSNRKWAKWFARFVLLLIPLTTIFILLTPTSEIDPIKYYESGNSKFEKGNYKGAIKDFTEALKVSNDPVLYYTRGYTKFISGDEKNGCIDIKKASKIFTPEDNDFVKEFCN